MPQKVLKNLAVLNEYFIFARPSWFPTDNNIFIKKIRIAYVGLLNRAVDNGRVVPCLLLRVLYAMCRSVGAALVAIHTDRICQTAERRAATLIKNFDRIIKT